MLACALPREFKWLVVQEKSVVEGTKRHPRLGDVVGHTNNNNRQLILDGPYAPEIFPIQKAKAPQIREALFCEQRLAMIQ